MQFELGALLKIPRGTPGVSSMEFDLTEIIATEDRKRDVVTVNKETAPELMFIFNKAYCAVLRMLSQVSFEYRQAVKHAEKRRSEVILDVAPDVLKQKGLLSQRSPAGSEDLRSAVLNQDDEYLKLQDVVSVLEATHEFLKGKAKGFEMDYQSVKKIYDVSNSNLGNLNLNHGHSDDTEFYHFSSKLGKAKY
jgi:hypothetical protein